MKRYQTAKEYTYIAVFIAVTIAAQLVLSAIPGVEVVTVLFITYAFVFGAMRSVFAALAFSLVRQLVFGFFPNVLILYLAYYSLLSVTFGLLGKVLSPDFRGVTLLVGIACIFAVAFTAMDCVITPLYFGYSAGAWKSYFLASLPVMGTQALCVGVTMACLFLPLHRAFSFVKSRL